MEKNFRKIPKELLPNIFEHVENLSTNPLPHDAIKLAGAESLYRIRVGEYRIIYPVLHESREVIAYFSGTGVWPTVECNPNIPLIYQCIFLLI